MKIVPAAIPAAWFATLVASSLADTAKLPGQFYIRRESATASPAEPGRIGVIAFSSAAEVNVVMPASKSEAVASAAESVRFLEGKEVRDAGLVTAAATQGLGTPLIAIPLVVAPAATGIGAIFQAAHAGAGSEPEGRLAPARAELQRAAHGVRLEIRLRDRVAADLAGVVPVPTVAVENDLLSATDPDLAARAWRQDVELRRATKSALARRQIYTALEIKVHAPALSGRGPIDPTLALNAQVRVRLIELPSGRELARRDLDYRGSPRHYAEWSANGAAVEDAATDRLTVGAVQKEIRTGMSGADVVLALGAPNIVTTDEQRREVWVYDKVASEVVSSGSSLQIIPLLLGTGSLAGGAAGGYAHNASATSHSSRTLTVVIKFDEAKKVRDFAYHATQF